MWSHLIQDFVPGLFYSRMAEVIQNSKPPARDLNSGSPEYEAGMATTQSRRSAYFLLRFYPIYIYIKITFCNLNNTLQGGRNIFMKVISTSPETHTSYLESLTPGPVS